MSAPTQILILGASGRVGQLVVAEALGRGVAVTALVRKGGSLTPHANLTISKGSPLSQEDIRKTLETMHNDQPNTGIIIVSTLGQTRKSGNPWSAPTSPPRFMAGSAQAVVDALESLDESHKPNVTKLIHLSMFGAESSMANVNFLMRSSMACSNMAQTVEDHNLVAGILRDNLAVGNSNTVAQDRLSIPYVMVRPAMLKFGALQDDQVVVHGDEGEGAGFMPSIQARDVARFLVDASICSDEWNWRSPVISN